ncbi:MAG: alpha/beta hydrolase [Planctomycetaceae bacterium]|nr:alpha/beta hydrolase [Planctomycetaceae bacterium]
MTIASCCSFASFARAQELPEREPVRPPSVAPTHADVKYGPDDRNVMDVWLAESPEPTPVLVSIHGGAFRHGDKSVNDGVLRECLASGISVVAITYRFSDQAIAPAQHMDAARAIQFIRHKAMDWRLDPGRIAATGGSAGAGMSLWLGFHDDLADPDNDDPVLQQSTRLTCMAVNNGQSSYDPRVIRELFPGTDTYKNSALADLFDVDLSMLDNLPVEKYTLFEEVSAINHLTMDDAPVLMTYDSDLETPISSRSIGIHHPRFGKLLKEKMDALGIECQVHTGFSRTKASRSKLVVAFVKRHFGIAEQ